MEQELREKLERLREAARKVYATGVKPQKRRFGVNDWTRDTYQPFPGEGCCMVGASVIGLPSWTVRGRAAAQYGLTGRQVYCLIDGFDGSGNAYYADFGSGQQEALEIYAFARAFAEEVGAE